MNDTNSIPNPSGMPDEVGTDSPQVDQTPLPTETPVSEAPSFADAPKGQQEAQATMNVAQNPTLPGSTRSPKIIIGLIIAIVVVVIGGAVGYYLMNRTSSAPTSQMSESVTAVPTVPVVSPTPKNEQEEVDNIDTTFPEADVLGIQTDLQGL